MERLSDDEAGVCAAARSSATRGQLGSTLGNALAAYPRGAATDRTFLALDHADCLRQEGDPREAARHATRTLYSLKHSHGMNGVR